MPFKSLLRQLSIAMLVLAFAPAAHAATLKVVAFGDSLMAGYQLGPSEGFVPQLEAALRGKGHDVAVTSAAVSGDTTSGGLARLDWSLADGADVVLLELGANDMLRGIAPEITRANLAAMIERLKERGIRVLLVGMRAAPNLGPDYERAFNAIYGELAAAHGVPLHPFFLDGVAANRALLLEDGMHPNPEGVAHMVGAILPAVEALMAPAGN